jgi:enhancing lycopene biosynthesis protein 2
MIAKILSEQNMSAILTAGSISDTSKDIEAMGLQHQNCSTDEVVLDSENKIVSTPAYMNAKSISEAAVGIEKLVNQIVSMIK